MDLDGTLLPHGGAISERTIAAIRAARARGVITTISSGRNIPSLIEYARTAGVNGPLIGMQGAIARELPAPGETGSGALLRHMPFTSTLAARAVEWCRQNDLWGHAVIQDDYAFDATDPHYETYQGWLVGNAVERLHSITDLAHHLRQEPKEISKVVAHAPAGHPETVLEQARETFGGDLDVTISHPEYLEFTAPGVNKGAALAWLASRLNIPLADTMAIGDQHNDLEMLLAAGHGVAMHGAPEPVQRAARYLAPPSEADGAARMIERLILGLDGD
jgi:Cof subfamily protein (haloacid dehalogenase superfamily)